MNVFLPFPLKQCNFENVLEAIKSTDTILISTDISLISTTLSIAKEEIVINELVSQYEISKKIIIYGRNCGDIGLLEKKNRQLRLLGFNNVYVYLGGMFEWILLQDIYGNDNFPTEHVVSDIIQYRPMKL